MDKDEIISELEIELEYERKHRAVSDETLITACKVVKELKQELEQERKDRGEIIFKMLYRKKLKGAFLSESSEFAKLLKYDLKE